MIYNLPKHDIFSSLCGLNGLPYWFCMSDACLMLCCLFLTLTRLAVNTHSVWIMVHCCRGVLTLVGHQCHEYFTLFTGFPFFYQSLCKSQLFRIVITCKHNYITTSLDTFSYYMSMIYENIFNWRIFISKPSWPAKLILTISPFNQKILRKISSVKWIFSSILTSPLFTLPQGHQSL